jgi:hypothetical protein
MLKFALLLLLVLQFLPFNGTVIKYITLALKIFAKILEKK